VACLAVRANLFKFQIRLIGVLVIAHNSLISILVRTGRVPAIEDGFSQNQIETPWRLLAQSGGRHAAPSRQQLGLDRTFPEFSADIAFLQCAGILSESRDLVRIPMKIDR
jgi:hypothetical protein